jgi:hypothetical protein
MHNKNSQPSVVEIFFREHDANFWKSLQNRVLPVLGNGAIWFIICAVNIFSLPIIFAPATIFFLSRGIGDILYHKIFLKDKSWKITRDICIDLILGASLGAIAILSLPFVALTAPFMLLSIGMGLMFISAMTYAMRSAVEMAKKQNLDPMGGSVDYQSGIWLPAGKDKAPIELDYLDTKSKKITVEETACSTPLSFSSSVTPTSKS